MSTAASKAIKDNAAVNGGPDVDIERPLTIYDLEKQDEGPVYVLNNTDGPTRGSVTFEVPHVNGVGRDVVTVPGTWLPIDLLTKIGSRQQLINSAQFKRCLDPMITGDGRPKLILIHPDKAVRLLGEAGAAEEMSNLKARDNMAYEIKSSNVEIVRNHEGQGAAEKRAKSELEAAGPSPRVVQLMDSASKGTVSEVNILNSLRSMGTLTQPDLKFILEKADRSQQNIINWAKGRVKA